MKEISMKTVSNVMAGVGIVIVIGSFALNAACDAHRNVGRAYGGRILQGRVFAGRRIDLDRQHFQREGRRCPLG